MLFSVDPMTLELLWTVSMSALIVLSGVICLLLLPWRDEELVEADVAFRRLARHLSFVAVRRFRSDVVGLGCSRVSRR